MKNTRENFNQFGLSYHAKRQCEQDSVYNRYLDQPIIDALIEESLSGQFVLDLGCGSGFLSKLLAAKGAKVHGLDFSDTLVGLAREECPEGTFLVGDIKALPFEAQAFDLVASALVVHYEKELKPVFTELKRVLRPHGKFVFTIHHPVMEVIKKDDLNESGEPRLKPYFHNDRYKWEMLPGMELESYHHTFEAISEALFSSGFVIERILEAKAPESTRQQFPQFYKYTRDYPSFCGFRARHAS